MKTRVLVLLSVIGAAHAMFFRVKKEGHRCFLVDVPKETTFRAEYESPDTTDVMKTIVTIYAPDPTKGTDEKTLVKNEQTSSKGSTSFSAKENGPHWVCISLDSSNYALPDNASMRFTLKLSMGTSHEEYQNLAKKDQMDDLELKILKLRDRVSSIQRNHDYVKEKGMVLHSARKINNRRATWVSVLQIAILLVTGFYQAKHLQTYFHIKKLV